MCLNVVWGQWAPPCVMTMAEDVVRHRTVGSVCVGCSRVKWIKWAKWHSSSNHTKVQSNMVKMHRMSNRNYFYFDLWVLSLLLRSQFSNKDGCRDKNKYLHRPDKKIHTDFVLALWLYALGHCPLGRPVCTHALISWLMSLDVISTFHSTRFHITFIRPQEMSQKIKISVPVCICKHQSDFLWFFLAQRLPKKILHIFSHIIVEFSK